MKNPITHHQINTSSHYSIGKTSEPEILHPIGNFIQKQPQEAFQPTAKLPPYKKIGKNR